MMIGIGSQDKLISFSKTRRVKKKTIVVGLKSNSSSREMLKGLISLVVKPGDNVIAVHVQEPDDTFDLNTFHVHEDLCMSKQVDFLVKVCIGDCYVSELSHQVRVSQATILALGCSLSGPKESVVKNCLKGLPSTCALLVLDSAGRVIIQAPGTSQQGSPGVTLQASLLSSVSTNYLNLHATSHQLQKSSTGLFALASSSTSQTGSGRHSLRRMLQLPDFSAKNLFQRLALLAQRSNGRYSIEELKSATRNFSPEMVIQEGRYSKVYRAKLEDGRAAAVKFLKVADWLAKDLLREAEILSCINHENIVQMLGYCKSKDMYAVAYNLLNGSLKERLTQLQWSERMEVAIGVAKALDYLHHCCDPPIIHRDVMSSNILLAENCKPQLSGFGAAVVLHHPVQVSITKPISIPGTNGCLAPEYMMYGEVDEKIDVYSYGVVLLELITGKGAIRSNQSNHESFVLWARSLLRRGLCDCLIDPSLTTNYNKEEMERMMFAARLCLMHSSSRRPTMKMILSLFEECDNWLKMQKTSDELLNGLIPKMKQNLDRR